MVIVVRAVQLKKALSAMWVTLLDKVILVRPVQKAKARASILVTLFGTALQFSFTYSYVCFITHKSIPHKELSQ